MNAEEMRQYARIFVKYETTPLMARIGKGLTTFVKELEQFYGVSHIRVNGEPDFDLNETEPDKIGTVPNDLVGILRDVGIRRKLNGEFHEKKFEENELEYQYMRDNLHPPDTKEVKTGRRICLATAAMVAAGTPALYYVTGSAEVTGSIVTLAGLIGGFIAIPWFMKQHSEEIFPLLFNAAEKADRFIPYYVAHRMIEESHP